MKDDHLDLTDVFVAYLRIEGHPRGCLMFKPFSLAPNVLRMGWSMCSERDQFNYHMARKIAYGRMVSNRPLSPSPAVLREFYAELGPQLEEWMKHKQQAREQFEEVARREQANEEPHNRVTREMALDAGDPSLEGTEV